MTANPYDIIYTNPRNGYTETRSVHAYNALDAVMQTSVELSYLFQGEEVKIVTVYPPPDCWYLDDLKETMKRAKAETK